MSLLSFSKSIDRGSYEKLSIRDSARSLKKYGSTSSKNATKNESFVKHFVTNSDTLQGLAVKYNVTIEQIRRANKLWASDSLFLREYLLIPQEEGESTSTDLPSPSDSSLLSPEAESSHSVQSRTGLITSGSFDEENITDFLSKIDASIANTKEVVKKVTTNSEFGSDPASLADYQRRKPQARLKQQHYQQQQQQNNNVSATQRHSDPLRSSAPLNTVVTIQQALAKLTINESEVRVRDTPDTMFPTLNTRHTANTYVWPHKKTKFAIWQRWKLRRAIH
ncbi:lysM and putative peptidoglycan-binding domain-containing protein 2 isoform X2 [Anthonomus grandis grandis]|nr:lysM and putative peptidoglycan-binding domain-containing protein 2 isoform X2 [Anthonomus grandis grandis]XP_050297486.1 lysM and putative peptidoglycan-binding domain-containing protein 2 isoform X2 [Anthonomus grandis grandis]XP_050297487.1 lysM and putative peptidoglycan-binding domain-containing protein 2 isoform X2 [Anthonomus grandis grandis]